MTGDRKGEDFVTVKLKAGVGSLTIHDGRLVIKLAGAGPHRVTRAEWEASRELRQHAEEILATEDTERTELKTRKPL